MASANAKDSAVDTASPADGPTSVAALAVATPTATSTTMSSTFDSDTTNSAHATTSSHSYLPSAHPAGQGSFLDSDGQAQASSSDPALLITAIVVGTLSFVLIVVLACFAKRFLQRRSTTTARQTPQGQDSLVGVCDDGSNICKTISVSDIVTDGSQLERGNAAPAPRVFRGMQDVLRDRGSKVIMPPPVPKKDGVHIVREICQRPLPPIRVSTRFRPFSTMKSSILTTTKDASATDSDGLSCGPLSPKSMTLPIAEPTAQMAEKPASEHLERRLYPRLGADSDNEARHPLLSHNAPFALQSRHEDEAFSLHADDEDLFEQVSQQNDSTILGDVREK